MAPYSDYRENGFSKHRKVGRNLFILYFVFVKKQRTTERKKKRSKISGLESCYANRIYVLIGVELRPYGSTFANTETHASKLVVEIPKQEVWSCLRGQGVPKNYVRLVKDTYEDARTQDKTIIGVTSTITVIVGLHQGSSLSPYHFDMILAVMRRGIKDAVCRRYSAVQY